MNYSRTIFLNMLFFAVIGALIPASTLYSDTPAQKPLSLEIKHHRKKNIPIALVTVISADKPDALLDSIVQVIKKDLSNSNSLDVTLESTHSLPQSKKDVTIYFDRNFTVVIYLYKTDTNTYQWHIYDAGAAHMIKGKKISITSDNPFIIGHTLADIFVEELTGEPGIFCTKIAYCQKVPTVRKNNRAYKHVYHIYTADYDGNNTKLLVDTPTLNIAPRWNKNPMQPLIFYSESTSIGMNLVKITPQGEKKIACSSEDGMNMLASFSPNGKAVAYNVSRDIVAKSYNPATKTITVSTVISNGANNVSPNILDNGDFIVCSDFNSRNQPQIYYYHATTKKMECLTNEIGYCSAPNYNHRKQQIVYIKKIAGISQLYTYDLKTKKHRQLTSDAGNKDEPSWSPCGNYIVYSLEIGAKSRIATMHVPTTQWRYITPENIYACYPSWSARYIKVF